MCIAQQNASELNLAKEPVLIKKYLFLYAGNAWFVLKSLIKNGSIKIRIRVTHKKNVRWDAFLYLR